MPLPTSDTASVSFRTEGRLAPWVNSEGRIVALARPNALTQSYTEEPQSHTEKPYLEKGHSGFATASGRAPGHSPPGSARSVLRDEALS